MTAPTSTTPSSASPCASSTSKISSAATTRKTGTTARRPGARTNPEARWRKFTYDEILARDKVSLDIFWLRDDSQGDMDNLPEPDEIAEEIVENLEAGLAGFRRVLSSLEDQDDKVAPGDRA